MDAGGDERLELEPSGRRLGEIFVDLGFVTSDQLDAALALQRADGGRIGEILVRQGFLTRLDLASALAERWEPREPETGGNAPPEPERPAVVSSQRQPWSVQAHSKGAVDDTDAELGPVDSTSGPPVEERLAEIALLCSRLEARLATQVAETAALRDRVEELQLVGFVAFAPTGSGYRLVELAGSPPELGTLIELESIDGPLVVTRLGQSPLPFDSRPCVFLDRT